jgi:hypothetical protein
MKNKILLILVLLIGISLAQKPNTRTPASTDYVRVLDSNGMAWDQTLDQVFSAGFDPTFDDPILDDPTIDDATVGTIKTTDNIGAVDADSTEVTAIEYGDGYNHVTILTLTNVNLGTPTESSNEAVGDTIYVFPAGSQLIEAIDLYIALTADSVTTDTPEIGLGSVVGTGSQATLGAAGATMEDYWEGTAVDSCGGTAQALGIKGATAGYGTGIALNNSSSVKNLCLNAADGWAAGVVGDLLATGTVAIKWTTLR